MSDIHPFSIVVLHAPPPCLTLYFFGITLFNILPIFGAVSSAAARSTSASVIGVVVGDRICKEYKVCFSGMQFGC